MNVDERYLAYLFNLPLALEEAVNYGKEVHLDKPVLAEVDELDKVTLIVGVDCEYHVGRSVSVKHLNEVLESAELLASDIGINLIAYVAEHHNSVRGVVGYLEHVLACRRRVITDDDGSSQHVLISSQPVDYLIYKISLEDEKEGADYGVKENPDSKEDSVSDGDKEENGNRDYSNCKKVSLNNSSVCLYWQEVKARLVIVARLMSKRRDDKNSQHRDYSRRGGRGEYDIGFVIYQAGE